jgi:D-alanine-D-alanine ligase
MNTNDVLSKRVVVLAGGWSDEREISLDSGRACQNALKEAGFAVVDLLDVAEEDFVRHLLDGHYDVAYVAMHGRFGEDGCIQGMLEILHIPYTFSGVLASALGTEKDRAKECYRAAGIPTPEGIVVRQGSALTDDQIAQLVEHYGLPLFVKPAANGSSYGITRVNEIDQLAGAIERAGAKGGNVLVEQCIQGTEVTAPVIGSGDGAQALPIIQINTGAEFYDLKVKYEPSELHHVIPAQIDPAIYQQVQELAVRAHVALGCKGASRSDFIVTSDGRPYILETNTIPGMTTTSLLPDSARHAGIEFPELCRRFVEWALEEHESGDTH